MEKSYAQLNPAALNMISEFESQLKSKTGSDVILVAYQK